MKKQKSKWDWYAVKVLFESVISGEPNQEKNDKNYSNKLKTFEESIILVKARSFNHAYKMRKRKQSKERLIITTLMMNMSNGNLFKL